MKTLHIIENCDERYGGPAKTIPQLCIYLNRQGVLSEIHSVEHYPDERNSLLAEWPQIWKNHRNTVTDTMRFSPDLRKALERAVVSGETVIHTHNQWNYPAYCGYRCSRRCGIPLVHSLLGSLDFVDYRVIKKMLWFGFQKKMLNSCSCIHITKTDDLECLRQLGIKVPVALIPDGIDLTEFQALPSKSEARKRLHLPPQPELLLYLARIHPQKGVAELLDVFAASAAQFPQWELCIAGPCEDPDFLDFMKKKAAVPALAGKVHWTGMLNREQRLWAYAAADAFILPSRSENFGVSVAEALAAGLPAIATTGAPWHELETRQCGCHVNFSESGLTCAVRKIFSLDGAERVRMGENGKQLIQEKYDQHRLMKNFIPLYEWVLKQGPKPECVFYETNHLMG